MQGSEPPATCNPRGPRAERGKLPLFRSLNTQVSCPRSGHGDSGQLPVSRCDWQTGRRLPTSPRPYRACVRALPPSASREQTWGVFNEPSCINSTPIFSSLPSTLLLFNNNHLRTMTSFATSSHFKRPFQNKHHSQEHPSCPSNTGC